MSLLSIVWNVNPVFFSLGSLEIRYYGLCWAIGLILGYLVFIRLCRREDVPISVIDRIAIYGAFSVLIGSRLGHCFFYEPEYYLSHPLQILNIKGGGLASHGAIVGLIIGMFLISRREKVSMLWVMDQISIPAALICGCIRIGNFMNSEIYGHITSLPWGTIFVRNGEVFPKHPTQIYEALCYFAIFVVMIILFYKRPAIRNKRGLIFTITMLSMFMARFLIEFIKEVQVSKEVGWTLNLGQWLSVPFLIVGVILLAWCIHRPPVPTPSFYAQRMREKQREKRKK